MPVRRLTFLWSREPRGRVAPLSKAEPDGLSAMWEVALLRHPSAFRLVEHHAAFEQQVVYVPQAQRALHLQQHGQADYLRRAVQVAQRAAGLARTGRVSAPTLASLPSQYIWSDYADTPRCPYLREAVALAAHELHQWNLPAKPMRSFRRQMVSIIIQERRSRACETGFASTQVVIQTDDRHESRSCFEKFQ